jgi:hypothetical protein
VNMHKAVMMALMGARVDTQMYRSSAFDPNLLLDATTTEAGSLVRIPIPAGQHLAVIEEVAISKGTGKDNKEWARLDVKYNIDNPMVKEALGRDKVTMQNGIMLDRKADGAMDYSKGKNVILNRLRDAVGLNEPGKPFSFRMLVGKPVNIVVSHSPSTSPAARPGDVYENVTDHVKA